MTLDNITDPTFSEGAQGPIGIGAMRCSPSKL